jgi:hypothetical protein
MTFKSLGRPRACRAGPLSWIAECSTGRLPRRKVPKNWADGHAGRILIRPPAANRHAERACGYRLRRPHRPPRGGRGGRAALGDRIAGRPTSGPPAAAERLIPTQATPSAPHSVPHPKEAAGERLFVRTRRSRRLAPRRRAAGFASPLRSQRPRRSLAGWDSAA